jgi:hypothetical protein
VGIIVAGTDDGDTVGGTGEDDAVGLDVVVTGGPETGVELPPPEQATNVTSAAARPSTAERFKANSPPTSAPGT